MAEGLNAMFHRIGKQLAEIMGPYMKEFMDYLTSPKGEAMINKIVSGIVAIGKKVMETVVPAIMSFVNFLTSDEGQ